jgi:nucleoside-diphosphate-sugar epimerase
MNAPIIVTGASGFVGRAVVRRLLSAAQVIAMSRGPVPSLGGAAWRALPDLASGQVEDVAFPRASCVVHLAAVAHISVVTGHAVRGTVRRVNAEAPVALARAAARCGIRRFVFVSSIKALADLSSTPLAPGVEPRPVDEYGRAKLAAERGLATVAAETGLELVVVRPPLVYGPGVKGNFLQWVKLVRSGIPLPLASIDNRRSFVGVENLADLLALACEAPSAAGAVLHVTDGLPVSTRRMTEQIAAALNVPARLFPVPPGLLSLGLKCIGRAGIADRLIGSLEVDDADTRRRLGWRPRQTVSEGLAELAQEFR